jgi:hypothetical protein
LKFHGLTGHWVFHTPAVPLVCQRLATSAPSMIGLT